MESYITKKLSERNLLDVVENCREALRKGYLDDAEWEKEGIMRVVKMRDFEQFKEERRKANEDYDKFCEYLESVLPEIEKMSDLTEKIRRLKPLYEKALELDGKRRFYDRGLDDQFGETILVYHVNLLRNLLKEIGEEDLLFDIIDGYNFDSFRIEMLRDHLLLLALLPSDLKNKQSLSLKDFASLDTTTLEYAKRIAEKYTHSNLENTIIRLNKYLPFRGKEEQMLEELENKKLERVTKRRNAIYKIKEKLIANKKLEEFERVLKIIDELTWYNMYEDEFRHAQLKEVADYFLREEVAKTLYSLGIIPSPNPMDYPQRVLLKKMEDYLMRQEFHEKLRNI